MNERPNPCQIDDLSKLPAGLASLTTQNRWVNWNYVWDPVAQKWDKPPAGSYKNMLPYGTALRRLNRNTGIGFVLTVDDDIVAIDFDDIARGEDDADWAKPFIDKAYALGAYIETTVSGIGARIIGRTQRPQPVKNKLKGLDGPKSGFEIFCRYSKYITISGLDGEGSADVVIDEIIDDLLRAYPGKQERPAPTSNGVQLNGHSVAAAALGGLNDKSPTIYTPENAAWVWSMLSAIPGTISRDDWLNIGRALHHLDWGDQGFLLWNKWCSQFPQHNEAGLHTQWKSFHTEGRANPVTLGTVVHLAKQYGWDYQRPEPPLSLRPQPSSQPNTGILADLRWYGQGELAASVRWLVKNVLPETGTALISGQWGTGKSFVALDLANSVARNAAFANYKCKRHGGVLYIAAEGAAFIEVRLQALMRKYNLDRNPLPFAWLPYCPPLAAQQPPAFSCLDFCKAAATKMVEVHNVPLVLIIVDTLSAAHSFKDANDPGEAQRVFNVFNDISRQTGALVVLVDHYGKDVEAGTRGSSAKEGAADAVIACLAERSQAGVMSRQRIAIRKARGGAQGAETAFTLPVTVLGKDEDGDPVTTCTVAWGPQAAVSEVPKVPGDGWPNTAAIRLFRGALQLMLDKHGKDRWPFPDRPPVRSVELAKVREEFNARYPNDDTKDGKRQGWKRARDAAIEACVIQTREVEGVETIWLSRGPSGQPGHPA